MAQPAVMQQASAHAAWLPASPRPGGSATCVSPMACGEATAAAAENGQVAFVWLPTQPAAE